MGLAGCQRIESAISQVVLDRSPVDYAHYLDKTFTTAGYRLIILQHYTCTPNSGTILRVFVTFAVAACVIIFIFGFLSSDISRSASNGIV